jgi:hypothetical protein
MVATNELERYETHGACMKIRTSLLILSWSLLVGPLAAQAGLPDGAFRGSSSLQANWIPLVQNDAMAVMIKSDPVDSKKAYVIVSEYDRVPFSNLTKLTALTKWVNRMHAFEARELTSEQYELAPLKVLADGRIVVDGEAPVSKLVLASKGQLYGAVLTRFANQAVEPVEVIRISGTVNSTWESYISSKYFWSKDKTGGDYFHSRINTELSPNMIATFATEDVEGSYRVTEALPGLYTMISLNSESKGRSRVEGKIALFIDIVNWKSLGVERFTTEELLLINPQEPSDVGFLYERH